MSTEPRILRADFADGVRWLTGGADLLARDGGLMMRVAAWLVVITLLQAVPVIGVPLLVLISPALTAGMLGIFRRLDEGAAGRPDQLFDGFREARVRSRLLVLGGFLLLGVLGAVMTLGAWLAPQMDLQALSALMNDPQAMESDPDRLFALFEGVNLFGGLALGAVVIGLVLGGLYFAVPLVFFWNWPVMAALLWSLRAVLVNWRAFLGFALVVLGLFFALGFVFLLTAGLLALAFGPAGDFVGQLLSVLVSLFVQLLMAAAQWRAFRQLFPAGSDGGQPPSGGGSSGTGGDEPVPGSDEGPGRVEV
ncbi:hypothetical protein HFP89_11765 [Wenzhouxiangella sp. XN79A]|uniref:BPSS1780 family membrane protein n=1 Tax=Wenzhouxiangella sp. XN79A TaxID=2724193 RepID=UPI00144A645E|nr:BPSS1780 family membrane protein [Wenzhouxiangella sp. XN79A]NKI35840.1 hypothetical protein [Wenzhouxiangella sp. XN79A]